MTDPERTASTPIDFSRSRRAGEMLIAEIPDGIPVGRESAERTRREFVRRSSDIRIIVTDFPASGVVVRFENGRTRTERGEDPSGIFPEWISEVDAQADKKIPEKTTSKNLVIFTLVRDPVKTID